MPRRREFFTKLNVDVFTEVCRTKKIDGKVLAVIPAEKGSRKQASLQVEWVLPGKSKEKLVKIGSIKAGPHSSSNHDSLGVSLLSRRPDSAGSAANSAPEGGSAQNSASESASPPAPEPLTQNLAQPSSTEFRGLRWIFEEAYTYLNGPASSEWWEVRNPAGNPIYDGSNPKEMKPTDYFLWMFPMQHLAEIVFMTDMNLLERSFPGTTGQEILKNYWRHFSDDSVSG